ncbi:unnamed protein product [Linum trigynum]|uniref:Reverse transcriptase zinc-binding domain-containing protein n=1 Tax=Linum trigynum TaxID=586398 RepID=A0AAV2G754_9ROSI
MEFPRVAAVAASPDCRIADLWSLSEGSSSWSIPISHSIRGGAEVERVSLLNLLNNVSFSSLAAGPSRNVWELTQNGGFSSHSYYSELVKGSNLADQEFPFKIVWCPVIPPKVCSFIWTVYYRKILTQDVLKKKGWSFPNRCALCGCFEESIDHLFISCPFSREVWFMMKAFVSINIPTQDISSVIKLWPRDLSQSASSWCSRVFLHAFCWHIWLERNRRIFKDLSASPRMVSFLIARCVSDWLCAGNKADRSATDLWLQLVRNRLLPRPGPFLLQQ